MKIPFIKAHGAHNDFLLTWREELPSELQDYAAASIAICERNTGAGADGWLLMSRSDYADGAIELWNSDGSRSEISGNGTRCAAAVLVAQLGDAGEFRSEIRIQTGAGLKHLRLLHRDGNKFSLEMNMGRASIEELQANIEGHDATIVNVGNPQCAIFVDHFEFDWAALGARIERLPRFPHRTNVSFVRTLDRHTIEARFFERGAGVTMSSGTGSTGAACAAFARGYIESPVSVQTPAGPLDLRWDKQDILLAGPAEIVVRGEFFWEG